MVNFAYSLDKKVSIIFILTFTIISIIDSTIVKFITFSGNEIPTASYIAIFILFSIIFGIGSIMLLTSLRKNSSNSIYKQSLSVRYFHAIAFSSQLLTIGIILTIILQMIFLSKYNLILLVVSTYLTHITAILFLLFLVYVFVGWLRSKRNYTIALYMISFILISVSIVVSAIYLEYFYSRSYSMDRKPFPIQSFVIRQEVTPFSESLSTVFDVVYLSSFIAIWMATIALLHQYRYKVGRIKYILLMSVPLIYYSFTYQSYFGNMFSYLALESPIAFGVSYVLTFSATKQVGALLFSLTFLTASVVITKKEIRSSLLVSAIGIALLYGSIEITTLQYRLYPPFGLVTQAIMPLGSYLLLTGIFISSTNVARDAQLRGEISKSAMSQLTLLKTIGASQMEKELVKKFRSAEMYTYDLEATEQAFSEEDVKQMVREVLNELYPKARNNTDKTEGA
jgi:hypothetical protein